MLADVDLWMRILVEFWEMVSWQPIDTIQEGWPIIALSMAVVAGWNWALSLIGIERTTVLDVERRLKKDLAKRDTPMPGLTDPGEGLFEISEVEIIPKEGVVSRLLRWLRLKHTIPCVCEVTLRCKGDMTLRMEKWETGDGGFSVVRPADVIPAILDSYPGYNVTHVEFNTHDPDDVADAIEDLTYNGFAINDSVPGWVEGPNAEFHREQLGLEEHMMSEDGSIEVHLGFDDLTSKESEKDSE